MFDPFTLAMIGAGVGAFTNKKDPLKGALIGAGLGYGGGLLAAPGTAAAGTAAAGTTAAGTTAAGTGAATAAGTSAATGAGAGLGANAPGAAAFEASMGLPSSQFIANGGSLSAALGGTAQSIPGMTAGADGVLRSSDYFANVMGNPIFTGNEGLLSQIGTGAGSLFDMAKTNIPDYVTPQNLIGVSSILSNMNSMPRPVASGGGGQITGTPPQFQPFQTGQVYTRKRGNR
jgi:hypothetical protein